jgi:entericidin B
MTGTNLTRISIVLAALLALSACGNTIRGVGRDTANAVDATQDAGNNVANAAE